MDSTRINARARRVLVTPLACALALGAIAIDDASAHGFVGKRFFPATLVTEEEARAIVTVWLTTPMREPRYIRRLAKIRDLEVRLKPDPTR